MSDDNLNNTDNQPSQRIAPGAEQAARPQAPVTPDPPAERYLRDIMGTAREITLIHNGERYRLRITASGKLILTK